MGTGTMHKIQKWNKPIHDFYKEVGHVIWTGESTKTTQDKKKASEEMWDKIIWWASYGGGSALLIAAILIVYARMKS